MSVKYTDNCEKSRLLPYFDYCLHSCYKNTNRLTYSPYFLPLANHDLLSSFLSIFGRTSVHATENKLPEITDTPTQASLQLNLGWYFSQAETPSQNF